jgi:hypothetical protein
MTSDQSKNLKSWKKGQSGNPLGKPKGTRNRSTIVKAWLDANATDGESDTVADQLVRALIQKAAKGDVAAFRELFDSAFGKIKDDADLAISYTQMPSVRIGKKILDFDIGEKI